MNRMDNINGDSVINFQMAIENYDKIVKELNDEILFLRTEQAHLKSQLLTIIEENKELSQNLQNALSYQQNPLQEFTQENKEVLNNLREQINVLLTEKECITKLWQDSVKTIDFLEDELKVFQAGCQEFVPKKDVHKLKLSYEEKINYLELTLASTQKKLDETMKHTAAKMEIKHTEIDQSLENQAQALKIVKNLESEILKLQKRLQETVEEKNHLERTLDQKDEYIQGLKKKNSDCWAKVTEAVNVVEAALNEKDAALFREEEIKEENEKLLQTMTEIVKESEEKTKRVTTEVKKGYIEKEEKLMEAINRANQEIQIKTSEIEMQIKKCVLLENEIERLKKGYGHADECDINKLLVLEKNLESTFQKLLVSEKHNIQLISEKESMKNDLDQMAELYERNLKAKEIEISTLKTKVTRLEIDLNEGRQQLDTANKKLAKLYEQVGHTEQELKLLKENYEIDTKKTHNEKIQELSKKYNENIQQLQYQVEKKNEINQKWRKEAKTITDNLEKIINNLKQEVHSLKKENKNLKENLNKSEEKVNQYKVFLELISKDVNKISSLAISNGAVS